MATFTDQILVLPAGGVPQKVAAGDTVELSTGNLIVGGDLTVKGTKFTNQAETVLVSDNHTYVNAGYTTAAAQTGGLIVNYLPTATTDTTIGTGVFVAGVGATSDPTVTTAGAATFALADLVQISGSANGGENDGLYEVLSHAANLLTLRSTANGVTNQVEDFTDNQLVANAGDVGALITKVTVSVLRSGTDGIWESASGAVTGFVFADFASAAGATLQASYDAGQTIALIDTSGDMVITIDDTGTAADFQLADSGGRFLETDAANNQLILGSTANKVIIPDNASLNVGTGSDYSVIHDGTNTLMTSTTGNYIMDNTDVTGRTLIRLGTDTLATGFAVENDSGTSVFGVTGDGQARSISGLWMDERTTPATADTDTGYIYTKADGLDTEMFFFSDLNGTDTEVQLTKDGFLNVNAIANTDFVALAGGVTAGDPLYLASGTEVAPADATTASGGNFIVGIANNTAAAGAVVQLIAGPGRTITTGTIVGFAAAGDQVYLSETAGGLTTTAPSASGSTIYRAGFAITSTTILMSPEFIAINP